MYRNRILIENDRIENRKSSAWGHYVNIQGKLRGLRVSGHGSMGDSAARKSDPTLFSTRHIEPRRVYFPMCVTGRKCIGRTCMVIMIRTRDQ